MRSYNPSGTVAAAIRIPDPQATDPQVCTPSLRGSGTPPPRSWPCPFASLLAAVRRRTDFTRRMPVSFRRRFRRPIAAGLDGTGRQEAAELLRARPLAVACGVLLVQSMRCRSPTTLLPRGVMQVSDKAAAFLDKIGVALEDVLQASVLDWSKRRITGEDGEAVAELLLRVSTRLTTLKCAQ